MASEVNTLWQDINMYIITIITITSNGDWSSPRGWFCQRSTFVWYVAPPGECYLLQHILLCCNALSSPSAVSRAVSVLCLYSKSGHHPHPLGYLCAKFHFFHTSIAELAHGEKLRTHSLTQLI